MNTHRFGAWNDPRYPHGAVFSYGVFVALVDDCETAARRASRSLRD
jgi:hypothetical protein